MKLGGTCGPTDFSLREKQFDCVEPNAVRSLKICDFQWFSHYAKTRWGLGPTSTNSSSSPLVRTQGRTEAQPHAQRAAYGRARRASDYVRGAREIAFRVHFPPKRKARATRVFRFAKNREFLRNSRLRDSSREARARRAENVPFSVTSCITRSDFPYFIREARLQRVLCCAKHLFPAEKGFIRAE